MRGGAEAGIPAAIDTGFGKLLAAKKERDEFMPSAVSLRYARALVDTIAGPGATVSVRDPETVTAQLEAFHALLQENAELRVLFSTPAIAAAKKRAVLGELAARLEVEPLTKNFLNVVIHHDRMNLLGEIAAAFRTLLDERLGRTVAEITTARPLEEGEKEELARALRARTGKQVRMRFFHFIEKHYRIGVVANLCRQNSSAFGADNATWHPD